MTPAKFEFWSAFVTALQNHLDRDDLTVIEMRAAMREAESRHKAGRLAAEKLKKTSNVVDIFSKGRKRR